ncbi:hypothetical protein LV779_21870 [Streptomyces thinghirensis]|nr:hypothetical protein [Streptomyces thinghirensis]
MLYGTVGSMSSLNSEGNGSLQVGQATFLLQDADVQGRSRRRRSTSPARRSTASNWTPTTRPSSR